MGFVGALQPGAADPVAEAVALIPEPRVVLLGEIAGVADHMGSQAAIGVTAQHIDRHLRPGQRGRLFAEPEHLQGRERPRERYMQAILVTLVQAALPLQLLGRNPQQPGQPIPQRWPEPLLGESGLVVEAIGEAVGGQHLAGVIQQPAAHRIPGNQPDPVLIGHRPVFLTMEELQPGQPQHDGRTDQQHQGHQQPRLPTHTGLAGLAVTDQGHQPSRRSSSSSRAEILARVL